MDWAWLTGAEVEIRLWGELVRKGRVDTATDDGRIIWLSQDGVFGRTLFDKADGFQVWLSSAQLRRISILLSRHQDGAES
jgi:hypothetical protein